MIFILWEFYCEKMLGSNAWTFLKISPSCWSSHKHANLLPKKHMEKICCHLGVDIETSEEDLCFLLFNLYFNKEKL